MVTRMWRQRLVALGIALSLIALPNVPDLRDAEAEQADPGLATAQDQTTDSVLPSVGEMA